jgi:hypothetical protein
MEVLMIYILAGILFSGIFWVLSSAFSVIELLVFFFCWPIVLFILLFREAALFLRRISSR